MGEIKTIKKTIKKNYLVEKRNLLNEIQTSGMTLEELRFFCIYLSKINARDPKTRRVRFSVDEFQRIMDLGNANAVFLKQVAERLLKKIIVIPREEDGWKIERRICLFVTCEVGYYRDSGKGYVEINAHDDAMELLFEFKNRYFVYEIWNALRLKSTNQIRMYEILKQYEHAGERIIKLSDLKSLLGVKKDEYSRYNNFRLRVLESCRAALAQYTDIRFAYEPYSRLGKGGKVRELRFIIEKNDDYEKPLALKDFLKPWAHDDEETILKKFIIPDREELDQRYVTAMESLALACHGDFNFQQISKIHDMVRILFSGEKEISFRHTKYLEDKYSAVTCHYGVRNVFAYLRFLIEMDLLFTYGPDKLKNSCGYIPSRGALKAYYADKND